MTTARDALRSLAVGMGALLVLGLGCGGASVAAQHTEPMAAHIDEPHPHPRPHSPEVTSGTAPGPAGAGTAVALGKAPPAEASGKAPARVDAPESRTSELASPVAASQVADVPKRISARHVLVQWMGTDRAGNSVLRTREQATLLIQEVQRRAKAGDDLGRLAVEYSDEPNAGARGGSLGRFGKGQMVPAFEQVAFKLRVGEVSDIVETPFGFHIIQRTE